MKNAIILHGMPVKEEYYLPNARAESNSHWLPWLQKKLINEGIKADTPEIPHPYKPLWEAWVKEVERFEIGAETILIGHSCGGGFFLKYLSLNHQVKPKKIILVAPWIDPDGNEAPGFFDGLQIDPDLVFRTEVVIFASDNDMGNVVKSVAKIREALPSAKYKEFHKYGHFCFNDMGANEFPELLEACLESI